jgi:urea transport system substrate-binding protein
MSSPTRDDYNTLPPVPSVQTAATLVKEAATVPVASPAPGTSLPPDEPTELAHYRLLRVLGQGGMGKVYQAEDGRLQRTVALKVLLPEIAALPSARERFLREARAMAAVRNDHVVTIYEVNQADDIPYLAMEFLHGQTLGAWLSAGERPRLGDVLRIGREIATGLAAAQARGLIHRDIKPVNLWLEEPTGRVKILDFGLARPVQAHAGLTETGDIVGTPSYMAPEQARGEPVDGRTDLFSLGVVLYQLCTGQLPFRGNSVTAILTALAVDQPAPIHDLNPQVPPALADLVMQLLEKQPDRRLPSAEHVVAALRAIEAKVPATSDAFAQRGTGDATPGPTLGPGTFSNTVTDRGHAPAPAATRARGRRWHLPAGIAALLLLTGGLAWWGLLSRATDKAGPLSAAAPVHAGPPIRIGVLYSRTGTMAVSERPVLDGILMAVDEINARGGVLGRPVEVVVEDGQSDESVFARKAAKLIAADKVCSLFGCWTSASRKAVKAVVEELDHLLWYPVSYEGMEQSPNIVYGGSVPNQQILPALKWSAGFLNRKRWFLVGSQSVYSHAAHAVIRDEAQALGCQIVGESLQTLGSPDVAELLRRLAEAKPDLILNTVKGDTNVAVFRALRRAGITVDQAPTLSFALSEEELTSLTPDEVRGHYAAGNYFHSLDLPRNQEFLRRVKIQFDAERIVSDPMQTAYTLVHLWAQAVQAAGSTDVRAVRQAVKGQQYDSPEGRVTICPDTLHTLQVARVGCINEQERFIEVYASPQPIAPQPFPASRSRQAWEQMLQELFQRWGGRWDQPSK